MKRMKAGVTGFIPKDADLFETLQKYAEMGYSVFEGGDDMFREGDPVENVKRVHDMGLRLLSHSATVVDHQYPDVKELVRRARITGADRVTTYNTGATRWRFRYRQEHPDYDETMRDIEALNRLSNELEQEGLMMVFHNHDQEFKTVYQGVPLFWHLALKVPKLKFEPDLAWIHYAGEDPAKIVGQLGERVVALHVKDYTYGDNYDDKPLGRVKVPRYTTPGTGLVDLPQCFQAACEAGVELAIIEQDMQYHLAMEDSVRTAYSIMKETGYVE